MKDKIALWGTDEQDADILIALRLRVNDNCVDIWTFPRIGLDLSIAQAMVQDWDKIDPDNFPQPHRHIQQDMGQPSLLPDHIRTKDTDVISRAEKEWFVRVLSTKLRAKLNAEIEQLQAQTESLTDYDKETWDLAQNYWGKINLHFQSRDLNREDAAMLRDRINACFAKLKSLRKEDNHRYDQEAKVNAITITSELEKLKAQIYNRRANLNDVFEDLKKLQVRVAEVRLTKESRNELRDKVNEAFDALRNERKKVRDNKQNARIDGLKEVIAKMEKSAAADESELKFQQSRMNQLGGQLEMQLRDAKIQMVKSRLTSKLEKLEDMKSTLRQIELDLEKELKREEAALNKSKSKEERPKSNKPAEKTADKTPDRAKKNRDTTKETPATESSAPVLPTSEGEDNANSAATKAVHNEAEVTTPTTESVAAPIIDTTSPPDNNVAELGEDVAAI